MKSAGKKKKKTGLKTLVVGRVGLSGADDGPNECKGLQSLE